MHIFDLPIRNTLENSCFEELANLRRIGALRTISGPQSGFCFLHPDFVFFREKIQNEKFSHENEGKNRRPKRAPIVRGTKAGANYAEFGTKKDPLTAENLRPRGRLRGGRQFSDRRPRGINYATYGNPHGYRKCQACSNHFSTVLIFFWQLFSIFSKNSQMFSIFLSVVLKKFTEASPHIQHKCSTSNTPPQVLLLL